MGMCVIGGKDPKTVLLIHGDDADGATTFLDSSRYARTVTTHGDAQVDTAQSVFGGASVLLDGTGDYLSVADHADFAFGTGDFTIDLRFRTTNVATSRGVIGKDNAVGDIFGPFRIQKVNANLAVSISSNGSSFDIANGQTIGTAIVNTWHHIAVTRQGNNFFTFLDGVQGSTWSSAASLRVNTNPVNIGATGTIVSGQSFTIGWLDEIRFSKGVARWTANFTPPTHAY